MAQKKFTQLTAGAAPDGTEIIAAVQNGVSVRLTLAQVSQNGGDWAFPANAFPSPSRGGVVYVATADHGDPGDGDYVAEGTWFMSKSTPGNTFNDFHYLI
jgi:hypothetical protein